MNKYSLELKTEVKKIIDYYEQNDNFEFLQKIMKFFYEIIKNYIPEDYFIIPKKCICSFTRNALEIWEKNGSEEELSELWKKYLLILSEKKLSKERNKKEEAACNCMLSILYNGHDDPQNQFVHDFIELFIYELERMEIKEEYVRKTLEKYFKEIKEENDK